MEHSTLRWIVTTAVLLIIAFPASANLITFDDITTNPTAVITDGYQGFDWQVYDEFGYHNIHDLLVSTGTSATTSGSYAFLGTGFSITKTTGALFNVESLFVANENCYPGGCSAGSVRLQGLVDGVITHDAEYSFDPTDPNKIFINASFLAIEEFRVWNSAAEIISLDNLKTVQTPLPASLWLYLCGIAALIRRCRLRQSH